MTCCAIELCVFVCFRPYQHGADMLAGISLTLKQCNKADMATPAALALQGLRALCQAEVLHLNASSPVCHAFFIQSFGIIRNLFWLEPMQLLL